MKTVAGDERVPTHDGPRSRPQPPPWPTLARYCRLVGRLQFALLPLLVMSLPLTGWVRAPGHDLLGGMFVDLDARDVFLVVLPLLMSAWSAMTALGLLLEGAKLDPPRELPGWTRVLGLPPCLGTFFGFPAAALPGVVFMVNEAHTPWAGALAAAAAGLVTYLGAILVAAALTTAEDRYEALPDPLARAASRFLARRLRLRSFMRRLRQGASAWLTFPPFDGSWDPARGLMDIDHFVAAGFCTATLTLFLAEACLFRPWDRAVATLPAGALAITLGTLLIWVLGALTFHLRRYRLSPLLVIGGVAALGYGVSRFDHHFHVSRRAQPVDLSPREVVAPVGEGNLVVVTTTGGGILSAGWTTLALERLLAARPALRSEIRLVSGVSGGSVGMAFFLASLRELSREPPPEGRLATPLAEALHTAHARAMASSLDAVAYGLVFMDVPRLLTGDLAFFWSGTDRGYLLEKRWRNLAAGVPVAVHELADEIRTGLLPAPIFNVTAMETGRRVMITPVTFARDDEPRAPTFDEYLGATQVDLDLWTAARLSATFPFISPAARAKIDGAWGTGQAGHHMLDGGYNDNYGIASALDFLTPVMAARTAGQLKFRRLLIVQLRCSNPESPPPAAAPGIEASLIGPLLGILNVRDGATLPRNEAALRQFTTRWRREAELEIETLVFQPQRRALDQHEEEPLSWHMTDEQKAALQRRWDGQPDLAAKLCRLRAFLDGQRPAGCPP